MTAGSARPASAVPGSGLVFTGISPTRVCDTRPSSLSGLSDACTGKTLTAGVPLVVPLPASVLPADAGAVVANVTVTDPSGPGFLTVFPSGQSQPATSNLDYTGGQTVANLVTVAIGQANGAPAISVVDGTGTGAVDAVVDIEGYDAPPGNSPAGGYHPLNPARLADTRCAASPVPSWCAGEQLPAVNQSDLTIGPVGQDQVTVTGVGGVPVAGVAAVAVNVTVVSPSAAGFLTVAPGGSIPHGGPPGSSSINFSAGAVLANKVIVPVSASGTISVFNHAGNTDAIIDIDGWYSSPSGPPGATFTAISPTRLADTRCSASPAPSFCAAEGLPAENAILEPPTGGSSISVTAGGMGQVPANVDGAVLDVVDIQPTAGNYLTVYPAGQTAPPTSDVNYVPADTSNIVPGAAYATTGTGGAVDILNGPSQPSTTNIAVDVFGYYTGGDDPAPTPIGVPRTPSGGNWTLTYDDEFNGASLDTTHWATGWFASGNTAPVGSEEGDCYSPSNVSESGGTLNLSLTAQPCTVNGTTYPYTGALVSSNPSSGAPNQPSVGFAQSYGFFEAGIYVPATYAPDSGWSITDWPTWWTEGQNWPSGGEMDIFEALNGGQACSVFHSSTNAPPLAGCTPNIMGWHTFAANWQPGSITFYLDGVQTGQITTGVTSAPMYLILDNSVYPLATHISPATLKVDYVRVWSGS